MTTEAIILAGGLGTRLQSVVQEIPKPMARVGGKPFLSYLLQYLNNAGFQRIILSVGYKYEMIENHFGPSFDGMELIYSVEQTPLGTGGGIKLAMEHSTSDHVAIFNGDTFFAVAPHQLFQWHLEKKADLSMGLKPMTDFDRYGTVEIDRAGRVLQFNEKAYRQEGLINGGVYVLNNAFWESLDLPKAKFSFEKDVMEARVRDARIFGKSFTEYFIDIGVPSDYQRAQKEIPNLLK